MVAYALPERSTRIFYTSRGATLGLFVDEHMIVGYLPRYSDSGRPHLGGKSNTPDSTYIRIFKRTNFVTSTATTPVRSDGPGEFSVIIV